MSTTTDLTTLKINYLTQAQYDTARSQGLINDDELYLTPAADSGINDVTVDGTSVVTDNVAEITMPTVPTKVSDLTNDVGYITDYTETDPTVPSWAKASSKPSYTASEVGAVPTSRTINGKALTSDITLSASDVSALPSSTVIPTVNNATLTIQKNGSTVKTFTANASSNVTANITVPTATSDLTNDSGFITGYTETDPTVPSWAKASSKPSYTASEVGAVPTSRTVNGKALSSNITLSASDVSALPSSTVIPTITDTYSGTSSNGMSGKAVKSAIDALDGTVTGTAGSGKTLTAFSQTNGKVSATFGNISITKSQVSDFPTIPSKTSDLTNDSGYITGYTETDPVFSASAASGITSSNISTWNGKYAKPSGGIPKTDLASAVQTSLGLADTALQSFTETDPTVPSWAKQSTKPSYTASEISGLMDFFYPIGSYYETSDTTFDPNTSWGGTWELESEGTVHVSAGTTYTAGSSYGSDTHTHTTGDVTLTDAQIAHGHGMTQPAFTIAKEGMTSTGMSANETHAHYDGTNSSGVFGVVAGNSTCQVTAAANSGRATTSTSTAHTHKVPSAAYSVPRSTNAAVTDLAGASSTRTAHNHGATGSADSWQPSIAVNRWHRTA